MALTSGQFRNYMDNCGAELTEINEDLDKNSYYRQFMDVGSATRQVERDNTIENMSAVTRFQEGSARGELDFNEGYPQSYMQAQWGGMVEITKVIKKFEMLGLLARLNGQLVRAMAKSKEVIGASFLEYGDVAIASVPLVGGEPIIKSIGGDGTELFGTAHTFKSGGPTWSNKSASLLDLTETAIDTTYKDIMRWQDNTGAPLDVQMVGLIFPPEFRAKAHKVLNSLKEPATSNNAENAARVQIRNQTLELKWLSSTTDWYVQTDATTGGLQWLEGWGDEIDTHAVHPRTGNECVTADYSAAYGANSLHSLYKVT